MQYTMKCNILSYGLDCCTDCYGDYEMEQAQEHCDGEIEYNHDSKAKVIGYNLTDVGEINNKAEEMVKKIVFDAGMGNVDFREDQSGDEAKSPNDKPVIIRSIVGKKIYKWDWNFTTTEEEYGCTVKCEGSVRIVKKQSPNPNIPKKKKRTQWALKAGPKASLDNTLWLLNIS